MKLRKIKIKVLTLQGIIYRIFIICCNTIFFRVITGEWKLAIKGSLLWNSINVTLYYLYHYFWAKLFKLGK